MDIIVGMIIAMGIMSVMSLIAGRQNARFLARLEKEWYEEWRAKADEANENSAPEPLKPMWMGAGGYRIKIINWQSKKDEVLNGSFR